MKSLAPSQDSAPRPLWIRLIPLAVFILLALLTCYFWRWQATIPGSGPGWRTNLSVPFLGLALSVGMSLLVHLLLGRVELYRAARDKALEEIERRERAQEALRSSESRYRSVFNSAKDGILIMDQGGRIAEANPAACTMHGYSSEEMEGMAIERLMARDHQHLTRDYYEQIEETGSARLDLVHLRKDGTSLDVEARGTRFDFAGEPRILGILTDVSARKQAVQRHAQLSRKVLMAQEDERARVSRELHDELGQVLTAIHLELDLLRGKATAATKGEAGDFGPALDMVERAADELRRICKGLRPPLLDDLGLEPSVRFLVEEFQERTGLPTTLEVKLDEGQYPIPEEVALCIYRILQESLNNISRHAAAKEVIITLWVKQGSLVLSIYDNGRGFDMKDQNGFSGCGIAGMSERAFLVNGALDLRSEILQGTRVTFSVPLAGTGTPRRSVS